jgi:uncharacterized protein (DUF2384 family)
MTTKRHSGSNRAEPGGNDVAQRGTGPSPTTLTPEAQRILEIGTEAFGDREKAWRWLHEPNIQTGERLPIELIETPQGFDAVETVLYQIEYAIMG